MIEGIAGLGRVGKADTQMSALGTAQTNAAASTDFGAVLASVVSGAADTVKAGEAAAVSGIRGDNSVQKTVEAVMSAEQTLTAAIAIRDKAVAAYLELTRTQI